MDQECWIASHVNVFRCYGGVTRILQCDNLKTGVISHGKNEITLNKEPKASKKIVLPLISTVAPGEPNTTKGSRSDAYGEYGKQAV